MNRPKNIFTETQICKIIETWGEGVYSRISSQIGFYSEKWKLTGLKFLEQYSMNAIFFCDSEIHGDCVLKIGSDFQDKEFLWEYNVLREYNGRRFVRILESDIDIEARKKVMLLERISPGTQLKDEESLDKRIAVFTELFNGMHIKPKDPGIYKKYADGIKGNVDKIGKREDCKDLYPHILEAYNLCSTVSALYPGEMLLHGDLQYHNILRGSNGNYTIVDPQGRIGAHVFDIPRYILIEYYNSSCDERADKIMYIIECLEKNLDIPNDIIRKCFYIETASFESWWASVGGDFNINNVIFAEKMMGTRKLAF